MRAFEVLNESTADQLLSALNDIIASSVGNGAEKISLAELVITLRNMGFNATKEGILSIVDDSPFVQSSDNGELNVGDNPSLVDTGENPGSRVDSMADNAVDI
jgi:hypothetical protein